MKDSDPESDIRAAAVAYCEALHNADADLLEELCHERYFMTSVQPSGETLFFDKQAFVARARERDPFEGAPSYEILSVDVEPEMAHVKLWVDLPPRRFCDYLGFYRVDGQWKLITKLFRTAKGPSL
ncbi:MAG: nuclear transport factor 2 family protein [Pseudomonadota bacterium]